MVGLKKGSDRREARGDGLQVKAEVSRIQLECSVHQEWEDT